MTYAPQTYKDARTYLTGEFDLHPNDDDHGGDLDPAEVGIVGSQSHVKTGTSYHLGRDQLKMSKDPYSARLSRDKRGLTNGAAALDVGKFSKTYANGRKASLPDLSVWLVKQCQAGAADAKWIREIIYTADGVTVLRYDHNRGQTSAPRTGEADDSHLYHTHVAGYRDCEGVDKTAIFRRYVRETSSGTPSKPAPAKPGTVAPKFPGRTFVYTPGRPAMTGADIRQWQDRMRQRGWKIGVDGSYGPKSRKVAEAFQKEKRLGVDGKVGPKTWAAAWTAPIT